MIDYKLVTNSTELDAMVNAITSNSEKILVYVLPTLSPTS